MEKTISAPEALPPKHSRLKIYSDFARPFTLLAPMFGFISGGITAWGAAPVTPFHWSVIRSILLG
jgi:hypothetical protein